VQILEDDDERTLLGECLEKAPPCRERLVTTISGELGLADETDKCEEMGLHEGLVASSCEHVSDRARDLRGDVVRSVLLEDPSLRLQDLPESPERDPVAVCQAAPLAPGDELRVVVDDLR